ncbi:hypothetical protein ACN3XK_02895 [Actinomadura welshii]
MPESETRQFGYVRTNKLPAPMHLPADVFLSSSAPESATEILARNRYIAVDDALSWEFHTGVAPSQLRAPAADVERWLAATRTLVQRTREISFAKDAARYRRYPRYGTIGRRIRWRIRHPRGRSRTEEAYRAVRDRLDGEMVTAYREFDERAGDLADHVRAEIERREREYRRREKERERRERRERAQRAAALGGPDDPVWSCSLRAYPADQRSIIIWVSALDTHYDTLYGVPPLRNVTAREIQAEIARQRAKHPYTTVEWGIETTRAMRERRRGGYDGDVETWKQLTGESVERSPQRPDGRRGSDRSGRRRGRSGKHGPSSTYGSDSGGGDHGGGGHSGGDSGGGGYSGGFGGSF